MRNVTKFLAAGTSALALSAGMLLTGVVASAAPAATTASQSAKKVTFDRAQVVEFASGNLVLKLTSGEVVNVSVGKDARIDGTITVGALVKVGCIETGLTRSAEFVIVL
ncbi:hypothetical protein JOF53_005994 [Crossiella equi]|uniref:DUF5666 domain-containing protein n=1 Tax=Crossiella equi TaxID=130796 RepID=A0ABS5ALH8_9PSEU|nr:hypothetical protein [Crossiella equi]MBP2477122.1 hypothetical protein [Crossiella equi]